KLVTGVQTCALPISFELGGGPYRFHLRASFLRWAQLQAGDGSIGAVDNLRAFSARNPCGAVDLEKIREVTDPACRACRDRSAAGAPGGLCRCHRDRDRAGVGGTTLRDQAPFGRTSRAEVEHWPADAGKSRMTDNQTS